MPKINLPDCCICDGSFHPCEPQRYLHKDYCLIDYHQIKNNEIILKWKENKIKYDNIPKPNARFIDPFSYEE